MLEVVKGARPGSKFLMDHLLSLIVFGAAAAEFVMWPKFGNSTYFLLVLLAMADFFGGVAQRTRRRRRLCHRTMRRRRARRKRQAEEPAEEACRPDPSSSRCLRRSRHLSCRPRRRRNRSPNPC